MADSKGESGQMSIGAPQELGRRMCAECRESETIVRKVIPFANDDVPKYLKDLRHFEEESRKVQILVK